jgi:hypothetical protein
MVVAGQSATVLAAAVAYAALGISVIPCQGKVASLPSWHEFQERIAMPAEIRRWDRAGRLENVAIVCGRVSGNLVVVDLDSRAAMAAYSNRFPELMETYTVLSTKGAHLYYRVDDLPPTTRLLDAELGNIELRANGCYVVAPPSIHPASRRRYAVCRSADIMRLPHMRAVVDWIKELIAQKRPATSPAQLAQPVDSTTRWAASALNREASAVAGSSPGARNNTLNRAAFKLGQLVAVGQVGRELVERVLYRAAGQLVESDGEASVRRTIKSGLEAGIRNPRQEAAR